MRQSVGGNASPVPMVPSKGSCGTIRDMKVKAHSSAVAVGSATRRGRRIGEPTEARKPLEVIDIQLTNKPISLLQHKIYNVWVAFAQATVDAERVRIFEFPLVEVMELCGYASHNRAVFIDAAKELLDLRVEYASLERWAPPDDATGRPQQLDRWRGPAAKAKLAPAKWAAAQLVAFIEIDSANARMRIEFPEVLRQKILRPDFYRVVDLRKQQLFTSRPGLALYEYVLRFAGEKATPWLDWQDYSILLSGGIEPHKTYREFSKVLQRAVEQVNAHHDTHSVTIEVTKRGRAVAKLRIAISPRTGVCIRSEMEPDPDIVQSMGALGVAAAAARDLARGHTREYLAAQIAYVVRQQRKGKVQMPGAYLRTAIATNYASYSPNSAAQTSPPKPAAASADASTPLPPAGEARRNAELARIREAVTSLPAESLAELLDRFMPAANPMVKRSHAKSQGGHVSPLVLHALCDWVLESGIDVSDSRLAEKSEGGIGDPCATEPS